MPCKGPFHSPRAISASAVLASSMADSAVTVMKAFTIGFRCSIRARQASVNSTGDTSFFCTAWLADIKSSNGSCGDGRIAEEGMRVENTTLPNCQNCQHCQTLPGLNAAKLRRISMSALFGNFGNYGNCPGGPSERCDQKFSRSHNSGDIKLFVFAHLVSVTNKRKSAQGLRNTTSPKKSIAY